MITKSFVKKGIDVVQEFWNCHDWNKCMKDENVPIQKKYLLNGIRYIYSSYITEKLESRINKSREKRIIKVIPTGSNNVSSDIDTQIMVNICEFSKLNKSQQNAITRAIVSILNEGASLWNVKSIANSLDINLYPATLLNYVLHKKKCYKYLMYFGKNNTTCIKPRLKDKIARYNFVKQDYRNTQRKPKSNMMKYYSLYENFIGPTLHNLLNEGHTLSDGELNDKILNLVKYNIYADEVYLSVSAIIFVVWHLQMGNTINDKDELSALSVCAFVENYDLFQKTKKSKYEQRYKMAIENILPEEDLSMLSKKYLKLL